MTKEELDSMIVPEHRVLKPGDLIATISSLHRIPKASHGYALLVYRGADGIFASFYVAGTTPEVIHTNNIPPIQRICRMGDLPQQKLLEVIAGDIFPNNEKLIEMFLFQPADELSYSTDKYTRYSSLPLNADSGFIIQRKIEPSPLVLNILIKDNQWIARFGFNDNTPLGMQVAITSDGTPEIYHRLIVEKKFSSLREIYNSEIYSGEKARKTIWELLMGRVPV